MKNLSTLVIACPNETVILIFITFAVSAILLLFFFVNVSILLKINNKEIKLLEKEKRLRHEEHVLKITREDDYIKKLGLNLKYI